MAKQTKKNYLEVYSSKQRIILPGQAHLKIYFEIFVLLHLLPIETAL